MTSLFPPPFVGFFQFGAGGQQSSHAFFVLLSVDLNGPSFSFPSPYAANVFASPPIPNGDRVVSPVKIRLPLFFLFLSRGQRRIDDLFSLPRRVVEIGPPPLLFLPQGRGRLFPPSSPPSRLRRLLPPPEHALIRIPRPCPISSPLFLFLPEDRPRTRSTPFQKIAPASVPAAFPFVSDRQVFLDSSFFFLALDEGIILPPPLFIPWCPRGFRIAPCVGTKRPDFFFDPPFLANRRPFSLPSLVLSRAMHARQVIFFLQLR